VKLLRWSEMSRRSSAGRNSRAERKRGMVRKLGADGEVGGTWRALIRSSYVARIFTMAGMAGLEKGQKAW
jgi:hypothetical protein